MVVVDVLLLVVGAFVVVGVALLFLLFLILYGSYMFILHTEFYFCCFTHSFQDTRDVIICITAGWQLITMRMQLLKMLGDAMASDGDLDFWVSQEDGKIWESESQSKHGKIWERCLTIESVISILRFKVCPWRSYSIGKPANRVHLPEVLKCLARTLEGFRTKNHFC